MIALYSLNDMMIIKGLPHTFSTCSALTSQNTDEPSVTEFKVALRSYEETMKARGGTKADDDQVLYTARANANSPNRRLTCDNCGKSRAQIGGLLEEIAMVPKL